jgi:hypothetical protein
MLKGFNNLTTVCSCSNVALRNSSARNVENFKEKGCTKRQRQPSLDQFLPSHDVIGVWIPARASNRASSKIRTAASSIPSVCVDHVAIDCRRCSPSPPHEQPRSAKQGQDHFSLTLSLGSSTDDDCCVDRERVQQTQALVDVSSGSQEHELVPSQQPPCQQKPPAKCCIEYMQPVQVFPVPHEKFLAGFEPDGWMVEPGLSSLLSSISCTVNATVASPSSTLLSCSSAFSPISSCHSMVDSKATARNSPSCSYQDASSCRIQSVLSLPQFTHAATALSHVASGQTVLGAPPLFSNSPATFSHAFVVNPQRALLYRQHFATLLFFSSRSSLRTARRAVRLRPSFTSSSRSQQKHCCQTNL